MCWPAFLFYLVFSYFFFFCKKLRLVFSCSIHTDHILIGRIFFCHNRYVCFSVCHLALWILSFIALLSLFLQLDLYTPFSLRLNSQLTQRIQSKFNFINKNRKHQAHICFRLSFSLPPPCVNEPFIKLSLQMWIGGNSIGSEAFRCPKKLNLHYELMAGFSPG